MFVIKCFTGIVVLIIWFFSYFSLFLVIHFLYVISWRLEISWLAQVGDIFWWYSWCFVYWCWRRDIFLITYPFIHEVGPIWACFNITCRSWVVKVLACAFTGNCLWIVSIIIFGICIHSDNPFHIFDIYEGCSFMYIISLLIGSIVLVLCKTDCSVTFISFYFQCFHVRKFSLVSIVLGHLGQYSISSFGDIWSRFPPEISIQFYFL